MEQGYAAPGIIQTAWGSILISTLVVGLIGGFAYLWLRPEPVSPAAEPPLAENGLPYLDSLVTQTNPRGQELRTASFAAATTPTTANADEIKISPSAWADRLNATRHSSSRTATATGWSTAGRAQATAAAGGGGQPAQPKLAQPLPVPPPAPAGQSAQRKLNKLSLTLPTSSFKPWVNA